MNAYRPEVEKLLRMTSGGSGTGDVALVEQACRLADANADVPLGIRARLRLMSVAHHAGNYEAVLVAFMWCLGQLDRDPTVRAAFERRVLWYYKWVITSLSDYAQVSRRQIEQGFADMADRFRKAGFSQRAVEGCRAYSAIRLGDADLHQAARAAWLDLPRDKLSDCQACETDSAVQYDLEAGQVARAVATAEPILRGRQTCEEVPGNTFARLLLPLLRTGSADVAADLHRRSIRQAMQMRDFLDHLGCHTAYLAITGQTAKMIRAAETGLGWLAEVRRTWDRMAFLAHAAVAFERLAAAGEATVRLRVPEAIAFHRPDGAYDTATVAAALSAMLADLVGQLDRRNGNVYVSQRHQAFRTMVEAIA